MDENQRKEILDLLAKGKISIEETVQLLSDEIDVSSQNVDEPVHKVDLSTTQHLAEEIIIENEEDENKPASDQGLEGVKSSSKNKNPKWLRIKVSNLDSGKNKVSVNIPFSLVEFGIGMANVFSPENDRFQVENIKEFVAETESGVLVDVEDSDSNEHVKIFIE